MMIFVKGERIFRGGGHMLVQPNSQGSRGGYRRGKYYVLYLELLEERQNEVTVGRGAELIMCHQIGMYS